MHTSGFGSAAVRRVEVEPIAAAPVARREGITDAEGAPVRRKAAFALVLVLITLEYMRPQDMLPGLSALKLPMLFTLMLGVAIWAAGSTDLRDRQTRLYLGLLLLMMVHGPFAANSFWAFEMAKAVGLLFIVYIGLATQADAIDRYRILVKVWLAVHVVLAIRNWSRGGRGTTAFLGDENDFALAMNMVIPISFFLGTMASAGLQRVIYLGMTVLFLVSQMATLSRGGFVGLVALGAYCWWQSAHRLRALVLVILVALSAAQFAPPSYWGEIESLKEGTEDETATGRIYMWKIAWRMFLDNPVIGVGQGNVPWRFREYEIAAGFEDGLKGRSRAGRATHSLYFTLLPELGIVGTLLYIGLLSATWRGLRAVQLTGRAHGPGGTDARFAEALSFGLRGSLVGFLVSAVFVSVLYYPNFWYLMGFAVALERLTRSSHVNYPSAY